jgi:hypothetical protein
MAIGHAGPLFLAVLWIVVAVRLPRAGVATRV